MKIAIDVSPLQSGHKVRGVGFYLKHLKNALEKNYSEHTYCFFNDRAALPNDIDIIHYPYFDPFFVTLPLIKKYPTVVTVHDLTPLVFPEHFPAGIKGKLRWQIQKRNLQNIDMIIADSEASRQDIITIAKVQESKIAVAYLAAGDEFRHIELQKPLAKRIQDKYKLPDKFILYVGDVTWNKNLPNLIQAAAKSKILLVMVGKSLVQTDFDKSNPWNKDLVQVQMLVQNNPYVVRLGFVPTDDLVHLYNMATCFIMPSQYEGFGLPIIEAMQSGCPVITTKNGSLPEVAGDAALYTDGNTSDAIAERINQILNDDQMQKRLSVKGIARAKEFSWKKTASQTIKVYEKVIEKNKRQA
jgi:glycosyltransferase involved in cell wall biosynthesis